MKQLAKLRKRWEGIIDTIIRFPFTIILLFAAVISNAISINLEDDEPFVRLLVTFVLGACIYAVFQLLYERFYRKPSLRLASMGITIVLSILYYIAIKDAEWDIEITVRTTVVYFILLIAFLWIPVIKSRINFNDSFMAAFKAFFTAGFFNGVLFLGIALILGTTDLLITSVNEKLYIHAANIIFTLLAPIHFLSLIPFYPSTKEMELPELSSVEADPSEGEAADEDMIKREEALMKFITPTKFLDALISFVIIPITVVFTIILLLYIIMNITGDFWTDNLMEPLLVSYSIIVIIVYLLACTINNVFTKYFKLIFPKVLVPVVLFQTVSSILKIGDVGITYGRYYVIMFGIFATIAGVLFCIKPVKKNGLIAPVLIGLSLISIFPFVDVFSVSKANQIGRLEDVLERNNMLSGDTITSNANISEKDKQIIIASVGYLDNLDYLKEIDWLSDYSKTYNFEATFGFTEYNQINDNNLNVYIGRDKNLAIPIDGYDYLVRMSLHTQSSGTNMGSFEIDGKTYTLRIDSNNDKEQEIILNEADTELIRFDMNDIYDKFIDIYSYEKTMVDTEEMTFKQENEAAILTIIAESIIINQWSDSENREAEVNILIRVK